ncbi:hypothetical protein ACNHKD_17150 [Methylocystis sp. JAN1]|uniref:hypothetical protein n=1 Tax=Methylocystis sp. JAN1 TaxID=3397211 RepID=UPI003FA24194
MQPIQNNDEIRLLRPIQAQIIEMTSNPETVELHAGITGAVVFVHGSTNLPEGFEIEFAIDPPGTKSAKMI